MPPTVFGTMLSRSELDLLWRWAQNTFDWQPDDWRPLWLNGRRLGFLNGFWYRRVKNDWPGRLHEHSDGISLDTADWQEMAHTLGEMAGRWRDSGCLRGWRNELFDVADGSEVLFALERSAFRPLGLMSRAVHVNGLVAAETGAAIWVGRRSARKAVDPGKLDNLAGGGIASGEAAQKAMMRESREEAGLPESLSSQALPGVCLHSRRGVGRGLHNEILHLFDVWLPRHFVPANQDGEVEAFFLADSVQMAEILCSGEMMADSQLAVLSTMKRYGALAPDHPLSRWLGHMAV